MVKLLYDDETLEEPNPDFCRDYKTAEGLLAWEGYGIESIVNFLQDVDELIAGKSKPQNLEGRRPTFSEALFSAAVNEAAEASLKNNSDWVEI